MIKASRFSAMGALAYRGAIGLVATLLSAPVWAEGAQSGLGGIPMDLIFLAAMVAVFYFLLIRPQAKRAKEHRELVAALAVGDEVVTSGGILGKVKKVDEHYAVVELDNNVEIKVQKTAVQATLPKGTIKSI